MTLHLNNKNIIDLLIVILTITQLAHWFTTNTHVAISMLSSLLYMGCYKMARRSVTTNWRYYVWMWAPTVLVVVAPMLYALLTDASNTLLSVLLALPLFSLLLPLALLIWLRTRMTENA